MTSGKFRHRPESQSVTPVSRIQWFSQNEVSTARDALDAPDHDVDTAGSARQRQR
jgi:hypothetical protein